MSIYLVIGAGGMQGGAVARRLVQDGHRVRGLSRTAQNLPEGVEPFTADLADHARLKSAFADVSHVSVTIPQADPGLTVSAARAIADAALASGVERLVFNTGNRTPETATGIPPFDAARTAAETFLSSGVPAVVLRPLVYLENLCAPWVAGPLVRDGVLRYPLPADVPVPWLAHADLGAATTAALSLPGLEGRILDVGGRPVTGRQLAAVFAETLETDVRYDAQDPGDFGASLVGLFGPEGAAGIAGTYRWIGTHLTTAAGSDPRLGLSPTPPRTWVAALPWRRLAGV